MSKNNKTNRAIKKKQKVKRLKKIFAQQQYKSNIKPCLSAPVFVELNHPFNDLTHEQRKELMDEVGKDAKNAFNESLSYSQ